MWERIVKGDLLFWFNQSAYSTPDSTFTYDNCCFNQTFHCLYNSIYAVWVHLSNCTELFPDSLQCFCLLSVSTHVCLMDTHLFPLQTHHSFSLPLLLMAWTGVSWEPAQFYTFVFWQRSTSLEVSVTTQDCIPDGQSSSSSPSLACMRSKRRSPSIPAEMAAPSTSPYSGRPTGCTYICETGAANKVTLNYDSITFDVTFPHFCSGIAEW